jgi:hypothetical protein
MATMKCQSGIDNASDTGTGQKSRGHDCCRAMNDAQYERAIKTVPVADMLLRLREHARLQCIVYVIFYVTCKWIN